MVDQNYIVTFAPEFSTETQVRIDFVIAIAKTCINASFWPAIQLDFAIALYACHLLKIGKMKGAVNLGGEKVGDMSRTYKGSPLKDPLATTGYGLLFLQLLSTLLITPIIAGSDPLTSAPIPPVFNWPD